MAKKICSEQDPEFVNMGNHYVACHLVK